MFPKILAALIIGVAVLAACAPATLPETGATPSPPEPGAPDDPVTPPATPEEPSPAPWAPQAGDEALQRGEVFIHQAGILILESFPPQFMLQLQGSLPTPCHELRAVVPEPDAQNRIDVEVYSVVDPGVVCIQMLEPFETNISLDSFPAGQYTVLVNGEEVGEIDAP